MPQRMACTILNDIDYGKFIEACKLKGHDTVYSCVKYLIREFINKVEEERGELG